MPELLHRIERLEHQNLQLKRLLVLVVVVVVSVAAIGQRLPSERIRAQEFIITDAEDPTYRDGTIRAALGAFEGAPFLRFLDDQGEVRMLLALTPNGPTLLVTDRNGKTTDFFKLTPEVVPISR